MLGYFSDHTHLYWDSIHAYYKFACSFISIALYHLAMIQYHCMHSVCPSQFGKPSLSRVEVSVGGGGWQGLIRIGIRKGPADALS